LKLDLEKTIHILNYKESEAIFPHDSLCRIIEIQLKEDSSKKLFGKLSHKKRHELQRKLQVEKAMIQTQGTLYEMLRSNKYTEYKVNMDSLNGEKRIE